MAEDMPAGEAANDNEKNLKVEALRCAGGMHASPVANGENSMHNKPSDVVETAKRIYAWLIE